MANLDMDGRFSARERTFAEGAFVAEPAAGPLSRRAMGRAMGRRARDLSCRLRDILFVLLALPFVLPLVLGIAVMVKLDDPTAPVFFRQCRHGLHGRAFRVLKFRTMVPQAEQMKADLLDQSADKGAGFKLDHDPRVTPPGRILRALYLDELPQLWNVLRGEMTLVGPRPNSSPPDSYEPWQRERLAAVPGLTGSWQVMHPKPRDFETRCRIDIDYVRNRSFLGDLAILFQTLRVCVFRRTGC